MRETIMTPSNAPGSIGKFKPEQVRDRLTWGIVPDDQIALAAMHVIHVVPVNGTTLTVLNPTDPATVADTASDCYLERPGGYGHVARAGRPS